MASAATAKTPGMDPVVKVQPNQWATRCGSFVQFTVSAAAGQCPWGNPAVRTQGRSSKHREGAGTCQTGQRNVIWRGPARPWSGRIPAITGPSWPPVFLFALGAGRSGRTDRGLAAGPDRSRACPLPASLGLACTCPACAAPARPCGKIEGVDRRFVLHVPSWSPCWAGPRFCRPLEGGPLDALFGGIVSAYHLHRGWTVAEGTTRLGRLGGPSPSEGPWNAVVPGRAFA